MSDQLEGAEQITEKYRRWSFVAGVVPVPVADVAALTGVNLKMLSDLSSHYGVEFSESRAKKIIGALLGGVVPTMFAASAVGSAIKTVPGIGTVLGAFTMPVFAAAATTGLGKIFVRHFEKGGSLEDLDPEQVKESFEDELEKAAEEKAVETSDDLTRIQGIGPKLRDMLRAEGIETLAQLAEAEVSDLQAILDQGGRRRYQIHDPATWPEQAKALLAG